MNKKGFTLIELLAVISILGLLMIIAIPNVISIIDKGKKETFINDAKKFISLVEYETGIDPGKIPSLNQINNVYLNEVDYTDILETPDGDKYNLTESRVIIKNDNKTLKFYVILKPDNQTGRGVDLADINILNSKDKFKCIKEKSKITNTNMNNLCQ